MSDRKEGEEGEESLAMADEKDVRRTPGSGARSPDEERRKSFADVAIEAGRIQERGLRREEASRFLSEVLDHSDIPVDDSAGFLRALRSGELLLRLLNTAFDRKDKKVFKGGEVMDKSCNLDKFFDGCLRLGIEKVFSVEDLESGTSEGADAVAQTVLKLKTLADSKNASTPLRGGVFKTPSGAKKAGSTPRSKARGRGSHAAVFSTRLMQSATNLLHSGMGLSPLSISPASSSLSPEPNVEGLAPYIKDVLTSLGSDYEVQLRRKDAELARVTKALEEKERAIAKVMQSKADAEMEAAESEALAKLESARAEREAAEIKARGKVSEALAKFEKIRAKALDAKEDVKDLKRDASLAFADFEVELSNMSLQVVSCLADLGREHHSEVSKANAKREAAESKIKVLQDEILELKGNIRVYCRVRPPTGDDSAMKVSPSGIVTVEDGSSSEFSFEKVLQGDNEEVYDEIQPFTDKLQEGFNCTVFAYGQTGSGKSHTMWGGSKNEPGINTRIIQDIFKAIGEDKRGEFSLSLSVLEIYREDIKDLLVEGKTKLKTIKACGDIPGLTELAVSSYEEVLDLLQYAASRRTTRATAMNEHSSRSHSVVTVKLTRRGVSSKLQLVDLAGSERVKRSEVTGEQLKELASINKSLSALGDCIAALSVKAKHVPFRNSRLTQLLSDSLSNKAKVLMICCAAPEPENVKESKNTLRWAQRSAACELGMARRNSLSESQLQENKSGKGATKAAPTKSQVSRRPLSAARVN